MDVLFLREKKSLLRLSFFFSLSIQFNFYPTSKTHVVVAGFLLCCRFCWRRCFFSLCPSDDG